MRDASQGELSGYTTLNLGGPADKVTEVTSADAIVEAVRAADTAGEELLLLAGGSNVVVADDGFAGTVLLLRSGGPGSDALRFGRGDGRVAVTVPAGMVWDDVVEACVAQGWSGIECLSGIPGSAGATPIQNVGAYGQDVAQTIVEVTVYDRTTGERRSLRADECGFGYRSSMFKGVPRWVVLSVSFVLRAGGDSTPVRYAELARALGVEQGDTAPIGLVRDAVRELRRGKGMLLDPEDPDTRSVGSFFTNPVLPPTGYEDLLARCREAFGADVAVPSWPSDRPDGGRKVSAAWLIERAGFHKGHRRGRAAISTKHTLALTNQDGTSTAELLDLAREIRDGVVKEFGVELHPEPVLVGVRL